MSDKQNITFTVNGIERTVHVEPRRTLADALAPLGVGIFEMPITPQRILHLLREA